MALDGLYYDEPDYPEKKESNMSTTQEYIDQCLKIMQKEFNLSHEAYIYWEEELMEIAFKGKLDGMLEEKERKGEVT